MAKKRDQTAPTTTTAKIAKLVRLPPRQARYLGEQGYLPGEQSPGTGKARVVTFVQAVETAVVFHLYRLGFRAPVAKAVAASIAAHGANHPRGLGFVASLDSLDTLGTMDRYDMPQISDLATSVVLLVNVEELARTIQRQCFPDL